MSSITTFIIYVLELEEGKYYIGKTANLVERMTAHFEGRGSSYTKEYLPIKLIESYESNNSFDEDNKTKEYMCKYGINNVRGGSYSKIDLDDWMIKSLENEFNGMNNKCYKCGNEGHFANNCDNDNIKYLEKFNNENDIITEINAMKDLLYNIENYQSIINNFQYISFIIGNVQEREHKEIKIEISPELKNTICEKKNECSRPRPSISIQNPVSLRDYDTITIINNINKNHKFILDIPEISERIDKLYTIMNKKYLNIDNKKITEINNNINSQLYEKNMTYLTPLSKIYEIYYFRICNEKKLNNILLEQNLPKDNIVTILNKRIEQLFIKLLQL